MFRLLILLSFVPTVICQYDFAPPTVDIHPPAASPYDRNSVDSNKDDTNEEVLTSDKPTVEGSGTVDQKEEKDKLEGSGIAFSEEGSGQEELSKNVAGVDEFSKMMNSMDTIAEKSGIACPADVLFVVDSTSSVRLLFDMYKDYVLKVVEGLTISSTQDRVGVILFSGLRVQKEKVRLGQINDSGKLMTAIKGLPFLSGITATGAALNFAKSALESRRKGVRAVVVVITDGFSYDLVGDASQQLHNMPNLDVYTVTFGGPFVEGELLTIAGKPANILKGENSYGTLVNLIKKCPGAPEGPATGNRKPLQRGHVETATVRHIETATDSKGRHLIPNPIITDTEIKHFDDSKNAVHGAPAVSQMITIHDNRRADIASPTCQNDILFVFDSSGSMKDNFEKQLQLATTLVEKSIVGPRDTQFAAINYAGRKKVRTLFTFNQFNKAEIKKRINETLFISGTTATNEALMRALEIFSSAAARKDTAKPVLIVFTDGFSGDSPLKGSTLLHKMGVIVFVVGVNPDAKMLNMEEMKMIASQSSNVYTQATLNKFMRDMEILGKNCLAQKTT